MFYITLLFYFLLYPYYSSAEIREIFSLSQAEQTLEALNDTALVVFDVDETLIFSVDKVRRRHPEAVISDFHKAHFTDVIQNVSHREYLDSIMLKMTIQNLVEPKSAILIRTMQEKNIRVIALTHMHAGPYLTIESMEQWRYQQLYDLGIDLAIHNPAIVVLDNLPKGRISYPVLHKGVFATSRSCSKGKALAEFIKQLENKPKTVIFFDDFLEHVQSVDQEMKALGIPCTVFHYRFTERAQEAVDTEIATLQYQHLIENEQWLSDEQVKFPKR